MDPSVTAPKISCTVPSSRDSESDGGAVRPGAPRRRRTAGGGGSGPAVALVEQVLALAVPSHDGTWNLDLAVLPGQPFAERTVGGGLGRLRHSVLDGLAGAGVGVLDGPGREPGGVVRL